MKQTTANPSEAKKARTCVLESRSELKARATRLNQQTVDCARGGSASWPAMGGKECLETMPTLRGNRRRRVRLPAGTFRVSAPTPVQHRLRSIFFSASKQGQQHSLVTWSGGHSEHALAHARACARARTHTHTHTHTHTRTHTHIYARASMYACTSSRIRVPA